MKLKYIAHSSFLITSDSGLRIITDPYTPDRNIGYPAVNESADIVTVSHEHGDHNAISTVMGKPEVIAKPGKTDLKGITINGIATYHDESSGSQRGKNIVFCFTVDGINICHMGDLGHVLTGEQKKEIGSVDVLLIPVGGFFTIDALAATQICDDLQPRIIVPMHYKTKKVNIPITEVDGFISGKKNITRSGVSEVVIEEETLPAGTEIYLLTPALL
jgi:L-ascorbate metabolism protein UlaG (beta-lactamase superfamily)